MSDPVSLASLFDAADQAASSGDFAAAARLLGEAARAQEAALGPHHLDLANTLNNLAVAHERSGQLDAAEREYRRAHAIAARTLPPGDPLFTTSAQNLRDFCEANGRPLNVAPSAMTLDEDTPGAVSTGSRGTAPVHPDTPTVPIEPLAITFAGEAAAAGPRPGVTAARPAPAPPAATPAATSAPARPAAAQAAPVPASPVPAAQAPPTRSEPSRPRPQSAAPKPAPLPTAAPVPPASRTANASQASASPPAALPASAGPPRRVSIPLLIAVGAIAALVLWLVAGRRTPTTPASTETRAADPASPPSRPAPSASAPAASAPPPIAAPGRPPATASAGADGLTIGEARLCTSLSSSYRCDAAGSTVRPGRLAFYTRLLADRNTSVVHRWYRGDQLRQSIRLEVPARRQGFRTFSRGTVFASDGEWRVELRSRDGQLLHTERFTVR